MRPGRNSVIWLAPLLAGACYTFPSGTGPTEPRGAPPPGDAERAQPRAEQVASAPAVEDQAEEPAPADEEPSEVVEASPEPAPEGPTVTSVCESLCQTVAERCDKQAVRRCQGQCKIYADKAAGCEAEYRTALECQAGADEEELCGNVAAAKCLDEFRDIKRCERGEKPKGSETTTAAPAVDLPGGWQLVTDDQLHFRIGLPASAALDPDAKRRTWRAPEGGVEYVVEQLPTPGKAVTSAVLLRLVVDFVGYKCQKNLKLHGQFEIKDEVAIRFDSACHDGTEWHGMLRARPDQALATAYHAVPTSSAVLDKFIYSYKRLE
jgi:hypothetical protein